MTYCYWLAFRESLEHVCVCTYTVSAPQQAFKALKDAGFFVAYGREGMKSTKNTHPNFDWEAHP